MKRFFLKLWTRIFHSSLMSHPDLCPNCWRSTTTIIEGWFTYKVGNPMIPVAGYTENYCFSCGTRYVWRRKPC